MKTVMVNLKKSVDCSYKILIGRGLLEKAPVLLKQALVGEKLAVVCDSTTARLFGNALLRRLRQAGFFAELFSFPVGEKSKSFSTLVGIETRMLAKGFDRHSAVIALGGGVTGDLAGFVAATFMRGIPFVQVPTTLLAMVDSSIGGKVAIDLPNGKNSCGAFYQPKAVFIDIACLQTLPQKQLSNGLAEVVKHAVISDSRLFGFLEGNVEKIMSRDWRVLERIVKRNCEIKARIVESDEFEKNLRKIVNYGHTVGHALEVLGNYRAFSHGEAVSIGMAVEARIAQKLGFFSSHDVERQNALLKAFGLPIALPKFSVSKIVSAMRRDKKGERNNLVFVLPKAIGKMQCLNRKYAIVVGEQTVKSVLFGLGGLQ